MKSDNKTLVALHEKLTVDVKNEARGITLHNIIREVIREKWSGKVPNARIATHIKDKLKAFEYAEDPVVQVGYASYVVKIWATKDCPNYNDRIEFYIGKLGEPITVEEFEEWDGCHGKYAVERNEKRMALLNDTEMKDLIKLADAIDEVKEAWKKMEALIEGNENLNELRYFGPDLTGLKER